MRLSLFTLPVIAATLVAGGIGRVATAGAASDAPLHISTTTAVVEVYDLDPNTGACTHHDPATGRCAVPIYETDNITGDLVGEEQEAVGASATSPQFIGQAVGISTYSGTVKNCPGPGTALFRYVVTLGVDGQSGHNHGTVEVVPGSGTGGLVTLKGHGEVDAHLTAGGAVSTSTLYFSCNHTHDN
jgi:hypothetical protein